MTNRKGASRRTSVILALASILCWSWAATAFKKALVHNSPWFVVFAGSVVSTFVLFVSLVLRGKRVSSSDAARGTFFGFLNPFLYYLILLHAYNGLPAQIAMVVNYLWPVVLVILAVPFLGQKLNAEGIIGILISFSGVALMALAGRGSVEIDLLPLALAFLSTVVWAVYWLLNTKSPGDTNSVLFMSFLSGSVYLAIYGLVTAQSFLPETTSLYWVAYIGVFEMGVTYLLWNEALKKAPSAAAVSSLIFFTPFLALVPIAVVVGEDIAPSTLGGLVLVTAGILIGKHRRKESPL